AAVGPREVVLHEAEAWRDHHQTTDTAGAAPTGSPTTKTSVTGLSITWKNDRFAPTEAVSASSVSFSRDNDRFSVSAGDASVMLGRASVDIKRGRLELIRHAGSYRVSDLGAENLEAQLIVPSSKAGGSGAAPSESSGPLSGSSIRAAIISAARGLDAVL